MPNPDAFGAHQTPSPIVSLGMANYTSTPTTSTPGGAIGNESQKSLQTPVKCMGHLYNSQQYKTPSTRSHGWSSLAQSSPCMKTPGSGVSGLGARLTPTLCTPSANKSAKKVSRYFLFFRSLEVNRNNFQLLFSNCCIKILYKYLLLLRWIRYNIFQDQDEYIFILKNIITYSSKNKSKYLFYQAIRFYCIFYCIFRICYEQQLVQCEVQQPHNTDCVLTLPINKQWNTQFDTNTVKYFPPRDQLSTNNVTVSLLKI
jgi:hypothetical protein